MQIRKKHYYFLLYIAVLFSLLVGIVFYGRYSTTVRAEAFVDNYSAPTNGTTEKSWSHTIGNNNNRILFVVVNASRDILAGSSASYANIPMTRIFTQNCSATCSAHVYVLVNPPVGTNTVTITNTIANGVTQYSGSSAAAVSLYNVNTANPIAAISNQSGTGAALPSITMANTTTLQGMFNAIVHAGAGSGARPSTGQTFLGLHQSPSSAGSHTLLAFAPGRAGSTPLNWSGFGSGYYVAVGIAVNGLPLPTATTAPTATQTPTNTPTSPATTTVPTAGPTSSPGNGNIINLNFGINNLNPWVSSVCGDIRVDSGFVNQQPAGQMAITTNASCVNPGIVFSGDSNPNYGQGQGSTTNWNVGSATYPEIYVPSSSGGIFSSYDYLKAKSQTSENIPVNLSTICTLSNCTLPANLPEGIYFANSDVTLNGYTFPTNSNYVFLIDGNLTIRGNIITPPSSSAIFTVSGNIIIPETVGSAVATTTANLSGIFSTDKSFILQSTGTCADLRLNIAGVLIVNAGRSGGTLQNNRDLCADNATTPVLQISPRLDFILNLPDFLRIQSTILEEVSP